MGLLIRFTRIIHRMSSSGAFIIYGGTAPEKTVELYSTIDKVIDSVLKEGLTENEIYNAKEQLKGGFITWS